MNTSYFKKAHSWYADQVLNQQVWAARWKWISISEFILILILGLGLVVALPLKTYVPFPIIVNESQQVIKALSPNKADLPISEAMAQNDIIRYVRNREGFNAHTLNYQYKQVFFATEQKILNEYEAKQSVQNPESLINLLGVSGIREVKIHNVVFLDSQDNPALHRFSQLPSNVAQVDFSTISKKDGSKDIQHWTAIMSFDYQGIPSDETRAWENWNGFIVTSYRVNSRQV